MIFSKILNTIFLVLIISFLVLFSCKTDDTQTDNYLGTWSLEMAKRDASPESEWIGIDIVISFNSSNEIQVATMNRPNFTDANDIWPGFFEMIQISKNANVYTFERNDGVVLTLTVDDTKMNIGFRQKLDCKNADDPFLCGEQGYWEFELEKKL